MVDAAGDRLNPRKVALLAVIAVALVGAGGLGLYFGVIRSTPSPGQRLNVAWQTLLASQTKITSSAGLSARAAALENFAASVGRIGFPSVDEATEQAVIRDAVALAGDTTASNFDAAVPAASSDGLSIPASPAGVVWSSNYASDAGAFNQDVHTLFAELGMG